MDGTFRLGQPRGGMGMSNWISVDERLPAGDDVVLVWDGNTCVRGCRGGTPYGRAWYLVDMRCFLNMQQITHWMPLPAPPGATQTGEVVEAAKPGCFTDCDCERKANYVHCCAGDAPEWAKGNCPTCRWHYGNAARLGGGV
jgi:hypothetical protein